MSGSKRSSDDLNDAILEEIERDPVDVARRIVERCGISRQATQRRLSRLVESGVVRATGATRARRYELVALIDEHFELPLSPDLAEDEVWRAHVKPLLDGLEENVEHICHYGFTEMLNNAIDHSEGTSVGISMKRTARKLTLVIVDDGVGIFRKIKRTLGLADEQHAILELSKGKLTTDPKRHSGEGIFFTSRAFDEFSIVSGKLVLTSSARNDEDWLLTSDSDMDGTGVTMTIGLLSQRRLKEDVFDRFTTDHDFSKTIVPVRLAAYGSENLVSRSQAKRLLARFEKFREIVLDFDGVQMIGQAFADEIFRVFVREHPDIHLVPIRANSDVESFILRALKTNVN